MTAARVGRRIARRRHGLETMSGDRGEEIFIVDNSGDVVIDASKGSTTIYTPQYRAAALSSGRPATASHHLREKLTATVGQRLIGMTGVTSSTAKTAPIMNGLAAMLSTSSHLATSCSRAPVAVRHHLHQLQATCSTARARGWE